MYLEIKNVHSEPESIQNGEEVKFLLKMKASEKGSVKLTIRDIDGLLNFDKQELLSNQIYVEEGEQTVAITSTITLPSPVDYNLFEMQVNVLEVQTNANPIKFQLRVDSMRETG